MAKQKPKGKSKEAQEMPSQLKQLKRLLETGIPWPVGVLEPDTPYQRLHDDDDGERVGQLRVVIISNGDIAVETDKPRGSALRFRNSFGGGGSLRTHTALTILALAMKWDAEDQRPN